MDPRARALYDEIAGFSLDSVNPFLDTSFEADQVFVDEITCIGCRNCNNVCPKTFGMEEDWGRARAMQQNIDTPEKLQEAIDTCPVSCIYWVRPRTCCPDTLWPAIGVHGGHPTRRFYKDWASFRLSPVQVTAPQLSLLDAAMARLERKPVWATMSSGKGANVDVFTVSKSPKITKTHPHPKRGHQRIHSNLSHVLK